MGYGYNLGAGAGGFFPLTLSATPVEIPFVNVGYNHPPGAYSSSTGRYTVSTAGYYIVYANLVFQGVSTASFTNAYVYISVNGSPAVTLWGGRCAAYYTSVSNHVSFGGSGIVQLAVNDTVAISISGTAGTYSQFGGFGPNGLFQYIGS